MGQAPWHNIPAHGCSFREHLTCGSICIYIQKVFGVNGGVTVQFEVWRKS